MSGYRVYGRTLESDLLLPELVEDAPGIPDLTFRRAMLPDADDGWFEIWPWTDGRPWIRAQRAARGYRVRYEGCADFLIEPRTGTITCDVDRAPLHTLRHFLLDQVIPLLLSLEAPVLHASSVRLGSTLTAFIGSGGAGKSTLAAMLGRLGHPVGSDDGLLVSLEGRRVRATASYPGVRLWPDSAAVTASGSPLVTGAPDGAKLRFRDGIAFVSGPLPLTRLYVLESSPDAETTIEPLAPRETAMELVKQTFRLALDERVHMAGELAQLSRMALLIEAFRLRAPRALDRLPDVARQVERHAAGQAAAAV